MRKYHNLQGWLRDFEACLESGDELGDRVIAVLEAALALEDDDGDPAGAGLVEDGVQHADGSEGTGTSAGAAGSGVEDVDADHARMVRMAEHARERVRVQMEPAGGTGGVSASRLATVLIQGGNRAALPKPPKAKVRRG